MKHIIIYLIILLSVVALAEARTVEMTLHTAKTLDPVKKYALLPKTDKLTDADAAPLYEKALQSLPSDLAMEEIDTWLRTPLDRLPRKKVQTVLEKLEPALKLLEHAARCKQCNWPYLYDDEIAEILGQYRRLIFFLALKMRFHIAQSRYDDAIGIAQTGFAMARHLSDEPTPIRGYAGIGIAAYTCRQLEEFIQGSDAPNLYQALRDLPKPLVDLTKQVQWEDEDSKGKVHSLMNRLDRHVAALQCLEAIRLYAAAHDGKFPNQLSDITQVPVPDDSVTRKPFIYNRTGSKAVLEGPAPEAAPAKEAIRYELSLKE